MEIGYQQVGVFQNVALVAMTHETLQEFHEWTIKTDEKKIPPHPLRLLSAEAFAKEVGFSTNTVREWCKTILQDAASNLGNKWLIDAEKAKRILLEQRNNPQLVKKSYKQLQNRSKKQRKRHIPSVPNNS